MRFAVRALVIKANIKTPLLVAFAATAVTLAISVLPVDRNRNRASGGKPHVTLKVVTSLQTRLPPAPIRDHAVA